MAEPSVIVREVKHIRALRFVAMAAVGVNLAWGALNQAAHHEFAAFENAIAAFGFLVGWQLSRLGWNKVAPYAVALVFLLHMVFVTVAFGYRTGAHQFFLLGTVVPYLIFPRSERITANILAFVSGSAYLGCVVLQDSLDGIIMVGDVSSMADLNAIFLLLVLAATTSFFVSSMRQVEDLLEVEYARSEALLYNLLPSQIAARLKADPDGTIADSLPQVAILFADIVDFTPRSARMEPTDLVVLLNRIFSAFDFLAEKHGLEKIKTIGDAYMVAAGMPNPCCDPVHRVANMALDILEVAVEFPGDVEIRIGLHTGPAVAGVIGSRKLFYDVWGETVNTASRMESHGEAGRIQVTEAVKSALDGEYSFVSRGLISVKGIGEVETWWLVGLKKMDCI